MNENHQKTILVVEDQSEISDNMSAMLTRKGYQVLSAIDAEAAIRIAQQTVPAMILTDLDLPSLGELMNQLRSDDELKHLTVAVIDINHPKETHDGLKILHNFEELDELLSQSN